MIISDTLHYRPDGTVSGVTRVTRESYTTSAGHARSEDVSSSESLEVVTALLGTGYAELGQHNAALEQQIVSEREAAETERAAALANLRSEMRAAYADTLVSLRADHQRDVAQLQARVLELEAAVRENA